MNASSYHPVDTIAAAPAAIVKPAKNYRPAYIAAWVLIAIVLFIAIAGSWIMPYDISDDNANLLARDPKGSHVAVSPPFPPSSEHLLGTDIRGLDLLSLLMNGLKYTLSIGLIITAIRFLFALPLGLWSGATGKLRSLISSLQWLTTSVPPLLFVLPPLMAMYYALNMNVAPDVNSPNYIFFLTVFFIMVSFIGIFPVCKQVAERARYYHDQPYVTASSAMGGSLHHRIFKHLLPNMRGELTFMFLTEFLQVMFLLGQLAVLNIFVSGGALAVSGDFAAVYLTSSTGEWFGMLAYSIRTFRFEPWVILSVCFLMLALFAIIQFFIIQLQKGPYRSGNRNA